MKFLVSSALLLSLNAANGYYVPNAYKVVQTRRVASKPIKSVARPPAVRASLSTSIMTVSSVYSTSIISLLSPLVPTASMVTQPTVAPVTLEAFTSTFTSVTSAVPTAPVLVSSAATSVLTGAYATPVFTQSAAAPVLSEAYTTSMLTQSITVSVLTETIPISALSGASAVSAFTQPIIAPVITQLPVTIGTAQSALAPSVVEVPTTAVATGAPVASVANKRGPTMSIRIYGRAKRQQLLALMLISPNNCYNIPDASSAVFGIGGAGTGIITLYAGSDCSGKSYTASNRVTLSLDDIKGVELGSVAKSIKWSL
ncbi:hypothetical protein AX774_g1769 [Zancudomyces culisetae]|uniref:Uncharacterized protein n=1 Tax=Zancudomyces culisetae TaxID=1213189 RepID=A0A1R1PUY2_ZANCU|nr:hypothetical protein AX774_g1769 [Zancudomyces culisetae]|eukprot:OMH84702.1 hypothetical protein AX774_g1769 [Zancudomyces culisetae]